MKIRRKKKKLKIARRKPEVTRSAVFQFVKGSGKRGATAREIAKQCGLPDALPVMRLLGQLSDAGKVCSAYRAARPGLPYAQESQYWLSRFGAAKADHVAATRAKRQAKG